MNENDNNDNTKNTSFQVVSYYDHDFEWEDAKQTRQPLIDQQEIQFLHNPPSEQALAESWDAFYKTHFNKFFKTRSYLHQAFPQIENIVAANPQKCKCVEIGCGTGASLVPLLKIYKTLYANALDVSPTAIETFQKTLEQMQDRDIPSRCIPQTCNAVTADLPVDANSMDFALMIFTLSAISPNDHVNVFRKTLASLKPGGFLFFRDYGMYDMIQTRCKSRIGENLYIKSDGVQCYFFSIEYIQECCKQFHCTIEDARYCTIRNINRKKNMHIDRVFINISIQKL